MTEQEVREKILLLDPDISTESLNAAVSRIMAQAAKNPELTIKDVQKRVVILSGSGPDFLRKLKELEEIIGPILP